MLLRFFSIQGYVFQESGGSNPVCDWFAAGIVSLAFTYTGLPWPRKDTEPLLAFGLFLVAIAGMASIGD